MCSPARWLSRACLGKAIILEEQVEHKLCFRTCCPPPLPEIIAKTLAASGWSATVRCPRPKLVWRRTSASVPSYITAATPLQKPHFPQPFLCSSRACLGRWIVFSIKISSQKGAFSHQSSNAHCSTTTCGLLPPFKLAPCTVSAVVAPVNQT